MEEISARDFGKMEKAVENLGNQVTKYGNNEYLAEKITCKVNGKPKTYIRNSYKNGMVEYMI